MRVSALTAGILLTTAIVSIFSIPPALAHKSTVTCLCDCPGDHKVKTQAAVRPAAPPPRRVARRAARRYAGGGHYNYAKTGCPGQHLRKYLEDGTLRRMVAERLK